MSVVDEIRQANLERIKSIEYLFIQKSISSDLQYGVKDNSDDNDSRLLVSKSGEEIKQKLQQEILNISQVKQNNYNNMLLLAKEISKPPIKEIDSYKAQDWKGKVSIPLIYCYTQIYDEVNQTDVSDAPQMRKYNQLAREYFDKSIEERKINTIVNAIEDKKKYKLTVDIASKLGF